MVREVKDATDFEETIKNNEVVVADFHAVWCGPCRALAPLLEDMEGKVREALKSAESMPDKTEASKDDDKEDDKEESEEPKNEDDEQSVKKNVAFIKIDVDVHTSLAREHGISAMPTILVFKDAELVKTIVGANVPVLQKVIGEATGVTVVA